MNTIFDIPVSYYKSYRDNEGVAVPLHTLLTKQRPEHIGQLERVRAATTDEEKNTLKKALPLFTPSACLTNRKAEVPLPEKLVSHTGFMQFDIDPKDNPDLDPCQLRDAMAVIPFVAYVALSASGRGVWGLVRIERPAELARHYQHFRRVVESRTGIKLDSTKGSNETDLRYISHDPEARFNYDAVALPLPAPKKAKPTARPAVARRFAVQPWRGQGQPGDSVADVEVLVSEAVARGMNLLDDYQKWFAVGSGFARELGESGREMFHALSQFDPTYSDRKTDKNYSTWVRYPNNSGQLGAFFNICKQHGLFSKDFRASRFSSGPPQPPPQTQTFTNYQGKQITLTINEHGYPAIWDN